MHKFTSTTDPRLARFPPEHRPVLERAITTHCSLYRKLRDTITYLVLKKATMSA